MTDASDANADLKAKMREALDRKNNAHHPTDADGQPTAREKVHGSEVEGGGPKMHRRKAGGGGA
ncbi:MULTISPECIES: DUF5302 domain-containing protein [unclassified Nocardioides]|uniref:DUF5302 domain-containing protein n=1 Tax=unclassified Nocardioides TaxID=2615069 RepID=UPI0006FF12AF|nr:MULTISPECIES: DUF5302 domain-containing protein [unclassified Nocardioides]KQY56239.1 hypothetical protein ASD30_07735 [Nocardioides sp. Root140]KQZ75023.1 hypothetical protein ASD66_01200 [Nocardioides sp. Root151]KRF10558.1 hypothetical protein ASH02_20935 [Nocardioides sp. Soil796]